MFKGFYNLTSGMLTQQRFLNVTSHNLTNISTAGFKENRYTSTTFDDVMYTRVGNKYKDYQDIGRQSYIRASSQVYTDFSQGVPEPTGIMLDFAIYGDGFFAIQRPEGGVVYTRAGSFSLDGEGYLCLSSFGRVLDNNGQEILLNTDKIDCDEQGRIYSQAGRLLGQLGVYTFEDNADLRYNEQGYFNGDGAQQAATPRVYWKYLERSNTDAVRGMTDVITAQRAFQSAAEVSRMYDTLMGKAANDIGRLQ